MIGIILLFTLSGFLDNFIASNAPRHQRYEKPLYDYGFEFFDNKLPEILPNILLGILLIYFLIRTNKNIQILSSFIAILTFLYFIRAFIFLATEVPLTTTDRKCDYSTKWDFKHIKWFSFSNEDSCRIDYMFSGHTIYATLIMIYFILFGKSTIEKCTIGVLSIALMISLIGSRSHYSSDVLVSFFMTLGYTLLVVNSKYMKNTPAIPALPFT